MPRRTRMEAAVPTQLLDLLGASPRRVIFRRASPIESADARMVAGLGAGAGGGGGGAAATAAAGGGAAAAGFAGESRVSTNIVVRPMQISSPFDRTWVFTSLPL